MTAYFIYMPGKGKETSLSLG